MKILDLTFMKMLLRMVFNTRQEELTCDECFEQVDRFVEMELAGKNAAEAMPLVRAHLDNCHECHEEYQALLIVLKAQVN